MLTLFFPWFFHVNVRGQIFTDCAITGAWNRAILVVLSDHIAPKCSAEATDWW